MARFFFKSYYINAKTSIYICSFFGIQHKLHKSSFHHQKLFLNWFETNYLVGYCAKENFKVFFKTKFQLPTFHNARLKLGYPINGQRTRSNAKTSKKLHFKSLIFLIIIKSKKCLEANGKFLFLKNKLFKILITKKAIL